jgi:hypothetical protein
MKVWGNSGETKKLPHSNKFDSGNWIIRSAFGVGFSIAENNPLNRK